MQFSSKIVAGPCLPPGSSCYLSRISCYSGSCEPCCGGAFFLKRRNRDGKTGTDPQLKSSCKCNPNSAKAKFTQLAWLPGCVLRGCSATRLRGYAATRLRGCAAAWPRSFTATRLRGYASERPGHVLAWPGLVIAWPGIAMAWSGLVITWPGLAI